MADKLPDPNAPTKEIGVPTDLVGISDPSALGSGLLSWRTMLEDREFAPDLIWPQSVQTYRQMQTDAQLKGLLLATTLPIRRYRWEIEPNGARDEVVRHVADSLGLPIRGETDEPPKRQRGRFNHERHLAHALQALAYGHYYFEQVYELGDDGLLHLKKLGTRPPRTIFNFVLDKDGSLLAIQQQIIGATLEGLGARTLGIDRLLGYVWEPEDDADWTGRSMLRACHPNWAIKDRLLRIDATKHERNAMGIPWFEVTDSTDPQVAQLAQIASEIRAGEYVGGAGPGKLRIAGVEGTLPDPISSVSYHDEQMSKAFMLLFFNLGGNAKFGSKALGDSFIDWYSEAQQAIAEWYLETTQAYQIEDEVELNWGPEEQPPRLAYTRVESTALTLEDLVKVVQAGLVVPTPELKQLLAERYGLPEPPDEEAEPEPEPPGVPAEDEENPEEEAAEPPPPGGPVNVTEHTRQPPTVPVPASKKKRSDLALALTEAAQVRRPWPDLARAVGTDPKNGTARRARDDLLDAGVIMRHRDGTLAVVAGYQLPSRELRRDLFDHEVAAQVDFAEMERVFETQKASLVADYKKAQLDQIREAADQVEAAAGDAVAMAKITVEPVSTDLVSGHLDDSANSGVDAARKEFIAQTDQEGRLPDRAALEAELAERAASVCLTLANGLSTAAAKRGAAVVKLEPKDAADAVRSYLLELSDAEIELQLGGATMAAYNSGRREFMRAQEGPQSDESVPFMGRAEDAPPGQYLTAIYASEVMDSNTCGPCEEIDGREYENLDEAEEDYPQGGYVDCEGGLRCRGTLVAEYGPAAEAPPPPEAPEPPAPPPVITPPTPPSPLTPTPTPAEPGALPPERIGQISDDLDMKIRANQEAQPGVFYKDTVQQAIDEVGSVNRWPQPEGAKPATMRAKNIGNSLGHYHPGLEEVVTNTNLAGRGIPYSDGSGRFELLTDEQVTRATTHHELGHRLDHQLGRVLNPQVVEGRGVRNYATELVADADQGFLLDLDEAEAMIGRPLGPIRGIFEAIRDSGIESEIIALARSPESQMGREHAKYLLTARELWARAYAQYVATKLDDEAVLLHHSHRIASEKAQWTPEQFAPIAEAFDKALAEWGLRD